MIFRMFNLFIVALTTATVFLSGDLYSKASEPDLLSEEEWPVTCEDATDWLVDNLDDESKAFVRSTAQEDLIRFHHGWGTGIRNNFGLWRGNSKLIASCLGLDDDAQNNSDSYPFAADDVSMIIIERTWKRLNEDSLPSVTGVEHSDVSNDSLAY